MDDKEIKKSGSSQFWLMWAVAMMVLVGTLVWGLPTVYDDTQVKAEPSAQLSAAH